MTAFVLLLIGLFGAMCAYLGYWSGVGAREAQERARRRPAPARDVERYDNVIVLRAAR